MAASHNVAETATPQGYRGNDKLLLGMVLAVTAFWLFAGTAGTVAPAIMADINAGGTEYVDVNAMNFAVSVTALFSGLFIVLMGGIADRVGQVRISLVGVVINIVGSALLVFAAGGLALPMLITGRALQGFSAACIMPATMALVKAYWDGPGRQRAVSMWSIGSWGGSGLAAVFGGGVVDLLGWRGIFGASIAVSVLAFVLILGTPENRPAAGRSTRFDYLGLGLFVVATLALMVVLIFGQGLGWVSPTSLVLMLVAVVGYVVFYRWERRQADPFIDFSLFRNTTFTGATISNFLLNATIGMLIISQQVMQLAGYKADGSLYTAWDAGLLSIGYGVFIIAFIRVGEKLLQRYGPRKPMIWGSLIVIASALMLMQTELLIGQYVVLAVVAYCLFGLGLAFYATPSTDAALSNLPAEKAGSGSGIYKMASSLGGAMGAAISLAVFTAVAGSESTIIGEVIEMQGRTDNIALRQGAMFALGLNLVFVLLAILSITTTVPKGGGSRDLGVVAPSPAPAPQPSPDAEREAVIRRLGSLSLTELERIEKQAILNEIGELDAEVLRRLLEERRS
ncbi:MAG TPA: MFS transporter [Actinomycetaceae bacterium]|nr:MFS transporter [Actinomycetaceae bacterium]